MKKVNLERNRECAHARIIQIHISPLSGVEFDCASGFYFSSSSSSNPRVSRDNAFNRNSELSRIRSSEHSPSLMTLSYASNRARSRSTPRSSSFARARRASESRSMASILRSVARFLRCNSCKPTLARPRSSLRSVDRSRPSRARSPRSLDRTKRAFGPRPRTVFSGPRARTLLHRLVRLSHHERLRRRRVVHRRRRRRHRRLASASVRLGLSSVAARNRRFPSLGSSWVTTHRESPIQSTDRDSPRDGHERLESARPRARRHYETRARTDSRCSPRKCPRSRAVMGRFLRNRPRDARPPCAASSRRRSRASVSSRCKCRKG